LWRSDKLLQRTECKPQAEARQLALLAEYRVDTVMLARYMQVLSPALPAPATRLHRCGSMCPAHPDLRA